MAQISKDVFHKEHHSRNLGLLTPEEQEKINNTTLLIAGCGVGSQIAISAARIGFEKFILVDGDKIELSNNNRQGYSWRDVGRFKVDALAHKIKAINPHAHVRKYPIFVDATNAFKMVQKADIVVDTIDPDAFIPMLALHRATRKYHKKLIWPADVGWGAIMYIFDPESISYEKMIGLDHTKSLGEIDREEAFQKIAAHFLSVIPDYMQGITLEFIEGKRGSFPQPISAAYVLSAMVVVAAKRIALGLPVRTAPDYVSFDPNTILIPDAKK